MQKVRLKDIADELGISIVTVSNALGGRKGVGAGMKSKIISTARDLGYDLSKYEKPVEKNLYLGILVTGEEMTALYSGGKDFYQKTVYAAAKKQCYTLVETVTEKMEEELILPRFISEKCVDGVVLIGNISNRYAKALLEAGSPPMVWLAHESISEECSAIMPSTYYGMYKLVACFLETEEGKKGIGYAGPVSGQDLYYGYLRALREESVALHEDWVWDLDMVRIAGKKAVPDTLPGVVVCADIQAAQTFLEICRENDVRVPEDLTVVSYGEFPWGHPLRGTLPCYEYDETQMCTQAVEILLKKIRHETVGSGTCYVDGWIREMV